MKTLGRFLGLGGGFSDSELRMACARSQHGAHAVMQRAFSNVFIGRPVFIAMRGFLVMQMYKKSIEQYVPFAESIHFCRADGLRFAGLCYICRRMENGMKKYFGAHVSASGGVQTLP